MRIALEHKFGLTLILLISSLLFRTKGTHYFERRSRRVQFKNIITLLTIITLGFLWGREIKEFSFSIIAVAAALAIATKEFILCFIGGVYKVLNNLFRIGDRIEINDSLGDVIDHNFIFTKVLEIGPRGLSSQYTGRVVNIPNSLFLLNPMYNLTSSKKYSYHVFKHPILADENLLQNKKKMYYAALEICRPYLNEARIEMQNIALKEALDKPKTRPVVSLHFRTHNEIDMVIRVPVPVKMRGHYQQKILHRYLEKLGFQRDKS